MISKHPSTELLTEYSAGSLSIAPAISVTTHLEFCNKCRQLSESLAEVGGELLQMTDGMPVSDDLLEKVLACLDEPLDESENTMAVSSQLGDDNPPEVASDGVVKALPKYVRQFLPAGNLAWRFLSPSLRTAAISVGEQDYELALHKIRAGGTAPEHNHRGSEITVVLKGSFSDEDGVYQPGDFIIRAIGEVHRPFAAQNEECICLSVLEAPIELTGIKRVFNPFLSFAPC
jgi:putative transcriptional regulator